MMVETNAGAQPAKLRKLIFQLLFGAICGAVGMGGALWVLDQQQGLLQEPGRLLAVGTGLVYLLTGLLVLAGVLMPGFGVRTLNVEDADEIQEQRTALIVGACAFVLVALFLGALVLAPAGGNLFVLTRGQSALLAGASAVALVILTLRYRHTGDELKREIGRDACSWTVGMLFLLLGGWGAAAQLGYAGAPDPLTLIAGLFALYLLAVFIAAGQRGMLKPR